MGQTSGSHRGRRQEKPWGRLVEVIEEGARKAVGKTSRNQRKAPGKAMGQANASHRGRRQEKPWGRLMEVIEESARKSHGAD